MCLAVIQSGNERINGLGLVSSRLIITAKLERFIFQKESLRGTMWLAKLVIITPLSNEKLAGETMKFLSALALLLSLSGPASAQTAMDEQIALARQSAHTDRQVLIMGNVHFTADESAQFWPAWKEYRAAMEANGDRLLGLIKDFAANYEEMNDQKASELMTDSFSIQMQDIVIKQNFAKKITVFMPAQKVMRIIQIENKLDAAIDMQLAAEIPLVK